MKKSFVACARLLLIAMGLATAPVFGDGGGDRNAAQRFATLSAGPGFPEGIAADGIGNIYVATFDFSKPNVIHSFQHNGHLRFTIPVPGVVPLGLAFDAAGRLYVADFGNGNVLRFSPPFSAASTPSAVFAVCGGAEAGCGLNAIAFDAAGKLYVSDSFGGNIFKIDLPGGAVSTFFSEDLLKPGSHGFPPFGANGLAFDSAGAYLYIANTADDRILRLNLAEMALSSFAESVNGADGIVFDHRGRLWVAANQGDEVVALNSSGRIVARLGAFQGVRRDGSPDGLLFPASLVIVDDDIYVTNLALPLTPAVGDEPEEDVTRYTVSRIKLPHR